MLEYVSMVCYICVVYTLSITPRWPVLIVWITFLGEMIISLFLLTQGRCHVVIIMWTSISL